MYAVGVSSCRLVRRVGAGVTGGAAVGRFSFCRGASAAARVGPSGSAPRVCAWSGLRRAANVGPRRNRRRGRWERLAADDDPVEGSSEDRAGELSVTTALADLPDSQREALEMVKLEGLSVEEAAARSGVSPGALRVRIHRGYRALRARLLGDRE